MAKISGSSPRDDNEESGGSDEMEVASGDSRPETKSDDGDLARSLLRRSEEGDAWMDRALRLRIARPLRDARFGAHLEPRQVATPNTVAPTPTLPTPPLITSINTSTGTSSDQIVLSTTPPASPAESLPPTLPTLSTDIAIASVPPFTTVTTFISRSVTRGSNATASPSWHFSSVTRQDGTVLVIATPTVTVTTTRTVASSSSLRTSNSTMTTRTSTSSSVLETGVGGGGGGGGGGGAVATVSSAIPTSTGQSPASSGTSVSPRVVGGVLGGLAGLALILVGLLFVIKRHKRRLREQEMDDAGYGGPLPPSSRGGFMTERPALPFAAAASFFSQGSKHSRQQSVASEPTSEQGFYRVSGKKIDPVIGGVRPQKSMEAGPSYYDDRDVRTPATPASSSGAGPSRFSGYSASPTISTGPSVAPIPTSATAGSPVTARIQEEQEEPVRERIATPSSIGPPRPASRPQVVGSSGRDGLGRSLPSHDGSRASRFTEDV